MLPKFSKDFIDRPPLLLGIIGARPFIADPKTVDSHFKDFFDGVLADCLDTGEDENRQGFARLEHAIAELHCPLLVEQKILVDDEEHQVRMLRVVTFRYGVDILTVRQQLDVFALEEMRGAAEIAAIRTAESRKDFSCA